MPKGYPKPKSERRANGDSPPQPAPEPQEVIPRRPLKCDACGIRIGPGFTEDRLVTMEARWTLGENSTKVHTSRLRLCADHCAKAAPKRILHLSERADHDEEVAARR